ncbi:UDP-N-acetylmuramate dehydrogenase [Parathalassolituus penaei]|uniref:UDP-N-acetylenolpyruvoylglucosamine reductase n=1 Tax=Parathalassolituus penaei TaxID=2997323 RepID=A0A9X3EFS2_9GAMM|nr:UDP-N-acetylmuramate dehydrogenase [Parathalassolituus penaei]MCY0966420.1 UDP-N-acetylmuramate dehydrogenase [Parathalassolituus penaei]
MIPVAQNHDLTSANTLRLAGRAAAFAEFSTVSDLLSLLDQAGAARLPVMMLGGGSNVLLGSSVPALVLRSAMTAVTVLGGAAEHVRIQVEAGKNWHEWVLESPAYGHGLENLALIPGTVGAAPIQNIGAYGVEVGNLVDEVRGFQLSTGQLRTISAQECRFGYRDSVFKRELANDFIVLSVVFRLQRRFEPDLSYGPLATLDAASVTPQQLIERVCDIRRERLPDPAITPNAGSYFKNPVIDRVQVERLQQQYPGIPVYPAARADQLKLAAAWLIDQAGWKGRWLGTVGMHDRQALVLVTNGAATLADVRALQNAVADDVWQRFGVRLEPEPLQFGEV